MKLIKSLLYERESNSMGNINKILILAVLVTVIAALSGVASAAPAPLPVTFKVDKIERLGHYVGIPVLISGENYQFGYDYVFVFDGKYTIYGHATNNDDAPIQVWVYSHSRSYDGPGSESITWFWVPANGEADWSTTIVSPDTDFGIEAGVDGYGGHTHPGYAGVDIVDQEDTTQHTIDQGPMSDATATFVNGVLKFSGNPAYMIGLGLV